MLKYTGNISKKLHRWTNDGERFVNGTNGISSVE